MKDVKILPADPGRAEQLSAFIQTVFDTYVGCDYSEKGNAVFSDFIGPESIRKRLKDGNLVLTAELGERTVGMIEVRDEFHICLFFVDGAYQGKGIGRRLFEAALAQLEGTAAYMEVNASPFSVPIYAALGFRKTAGLQEADGIKFVPMRMPIEHT